MRIPHFSHTLVRTTGALLAAAGLLAGLAPVAPVDAGDGDSMRVTLIAGPPQLPAGATSAYAVVIQNSDTIYAYDGIEVLITTGGALLPTSMVTAGNGFACTVQPASSTTTGGFRCTGGALKAGESTTLTPFVQAAGSGPGRIEAIARHLPLTPFTSRTSLTVAVTNAITTGPLVRAGDSGERVTTIQYLLRQHGATIAADGRFGPQTLAAVRAFQQAQGLQSDGIVGPQTYAALFVSVQQGSQGEAVRAVQSQLRAHGIAVTVDGDFGSQTAAAVRTYQQQKGLAVDGLVGPQTWSALVAGK